MTPQDVEGESLEYQRLVEEWPEEWRERFAAASGDELVEWLNRETRCKGWVSLRGIYLQLLKAEFLKRPWDLTAVDGLAAFPGRREYALVEGCLVYAGPPAEGSGGVAVFLSDVPEPAGPAPEVPGRLGPEDVRVAAERPGERLDEHGTT